MKAILILLIFLLSYFPVSSRALLTLSQDPLFIASTEPRVMLLLSRDHELSKKAYTDYTDLNNDGLLDISYNDSVSYYGYFDPNKCYTYSNSNNRFEPKMSVTFGTHHCDGSSWSGNFLNWSTMTRLDVVRKVLYGGFRSTDNTGTAIGTTVLERAFLPPDVHAFAKVFAPNGLSGNSAAVNLYTPYSSDTGITLCNVTDLGNGIQSGSINTVNGVNTSTPPLIKVASGVWTQWAMTEILQCQWKEDFAVETSPTRPSKTTSRLTGSSDLIARVAVCIPGMLEDQCKSYFTRATTPIETIKPTGLLQQYGDIDSLRLTRFGLITGSYKKNTAGGVLRKNIKLLNNNSKTSSSSTAICGDNHSDDEVDVCTGQFINQTTADNGIIDTLNRIHIAGYKTPNSGAISSTNVCAGGYNYASSAPFQCSFSTLTSATPGTTCIDWGNPLSEMYHETLRYFAGKTSATSAYAVDDSAATTVIAGLGQATWNSSSDPLPANEWCALSNIIVLSTGLTSLDNSAITTDITNLDPTTLTNNVGSSEGISGSYLIGSNGTLTDSICSAKTLSNLSSASGICPELPHMKGGYLIAGLANSSRSLDLRPSYLANRTARWSGINSDWVARQPVGTYTVGLAENLPSFEVTVGTGKVSLVPACRSGGSTVCSMTDLRIESYSATAASFLVSWEDSSAGSDYDMDTIARIEYCVGSDCSPSILNSKIKITVSAVQSATGSSPMELGYTLSGAGSSDGTVYPIRLPSTATCNPSNTTGGDANYFSLLTTPFSSRPATGSGSYTSWPACPGSGPTMPSGIRNATGCPTCPSGADCTGNTWASNCGCPKYAVYTPSNSATAGLLKNPLWYTAKYGAPATSWDLKNNIDGTSIPDGEPDNFFEVRNPANLYDSLANVFDAASQPEGSAASVATNSTNLQINSRIFQAKFSSADWSGQLLSYVINTSGVLTTSPEWDAGVIINGQNPLTGRTVITKGASDGVPFAYANLSGPTTTAGTQMNLLDKNALGVTDNCGPERVSYLRGDASHEAANGAFTCASGTSISKFRPRNTSKLGDIVSSSPVYVSAPLAGYSDVTNPGYSTFQTTKQNRKPMVYVGGNDGMLHGFDASLDFSSNPVGVPIANVSGKELLAYIPSAVYPNLSRLNEQNYHKNHRYFVDSSPMVGDADLDSTTNNVWRTLLVGSMGAGGKGYFALDVTDPGSFSEATTPTNVPANILLWEFDETDMGYVFNLPPINSRTKQAKQIVKMANGKWAAILSNGYNSISGKAVLYVVYIEDGLDGTWSSTDYEKIVADVPTGMDNGLSTPVPFDTNNDGYVDTVYAGDIKGHIWKFLIGPNTSDTSITSSSSTWKVAFSTDTCAATSPSTCIPLFTATDNVGSPQPILGPPEITIHPNNGQLVLFGTGKYIEPSDNTDSSVQSFYGIWDKHNTAATTLNNRDEELLQQTLSNTACSSPPTANIACTLTTASGNFRIPSTNSINWRVSAGDDANCLGTCTPSHMGWFIDLPSSGERATGIPQLINKVIFFNTLIPSTAPCDAGGTGWLLSLDYLSGGLVTRPIFDTNDSGTFSAADVNVGGFQVGAALGGTTLIQNVSSSNTSNIGVGVSSLTSGRLGTALIDFGGGVLGHRQSWRELYP
jgi:type IV pilus assembly protein PilY1